MKLGTSELKIKEDSAEVQRTFRELRRSITNMKTGMPKEITDLANDPFWKDILYDEDGNLDPAKVAGELMDFAACWETLGEVIDHQSEGKMTGCYKAYTADSINQTIDEAHDEKVEQAVNEALEEKFEDEGEVLFTTAISLLTNKVHNIALSKGFWDGDKIKAAACAEELVKSLTGATTTIGESALDLPADIMSRHGFGGRSDEQCFVLMHSEITEALEAFRKHGPKAKDDHLPEHYAVPVELADCVIRIMDYCGARGYDLASCIMHKIAYNEGRPHKHGKRF